MAILTGGNVTGLDTEIDLGDLPAFTRGDPAADSFTLTYAPENVVLTVFGTGFGAYEDGWPTTGTMTGFRLTSSGQLVFETTGLSVLATDFVNYINTNNVTAFTNAAFGGADSIVGTRFDDNLWGYGGDDTIVGGAGRDFLNGGAGNNTLTGGAGADDFFFDLTSGPNLFNNTITDLEEGDRIIFFGVAYDQDSVQARLGIDGYITLAPLAFGAGAARLGNLGNSSFTFIQVQPGTPDYHHILFKPLAPATDGSDSITGSVGADAIQGKDGDDTLEGLAGNDHLIGGAGADTLRGGAGADVLFGGLGDDVLDGGEGLDNVDYSLAAGAIVVDLAQGFASGAAGSDTLISVEVVSAGSGDDYLYGSATNDTLVGGDGNDAIYGGDGDDFIVTGSGTNYVEAGHGADSVTGGGGNDVIYGIAGADNLSGGAGDDVLSGAFGAFRLNGGAGTDLLIVDASSGVTVSGGAGQDWLVVADMVGATLTASDIENWFGYSGNDSFNAGTNTALVYMRGAAGADTLRGGNGGDWLFGDDDNDTIQGEAGNDTLIGGAGADVLNGGDGTDLIYFDQSDTVVNGADGMDYAVAESNAGVGLNLATGSIEYAVGAAGNDTLSAAGAAWLVEVYGRDGDDVLTAGAGGSILLGEEGADRLVSGTGTDHFVGGAGADVFAFDDNGGTDYVYDWQDGLDRLDMSQVNGVTSFSDVVVDPTYAADGWIGVHYGTGSVWLFTGGVGTIGASDFDFPLLS